ncbi:hypothetical protein [Candidatus Nitrosoglobus terrae]|nr:hypothetical protein [Candidatus Nitrosoglobus terrae]
MKLQGSEGQGTGKLVSAINGTHFCDGSQADEQILNWLAYGLDSLPPSVPKSYLSDRAKHTDAQGIEKLQNLIINNGKVNGTESTSEKLEKAKKIFGISTKGHKTNSRFGKIKLMDITGELITDLSDQTAKISSMTPIITDITGEAVEKNVIYPAAYGSPDTVTDGWYWAASVDSSKQGIYAYTMHIQLHDFDKEQHTWTPINLTHDAYIRVSDEPKINGFTGAGIGFLPML